MIRCRCCGATMLDGRMTPFCNDCFHRLRITDSATSECGLHGSQVSTARDR